MKNHNLSDATVQAAGELLELFATQDAEAGALAVAMIQSGTARLRLITSFNPNQPPGHRLLLAPTDGDGDAVELAVINCEPVVPTPEGVASRAWYFLQLNHWQPRH